MPTRKGGGKGPRDGDLIGTGDKLEGFKDKDGKPTYRKSVERQNKRIEKIKIKPQEFDAELNERKTKESIEKSQAKANSSSPKSNPSAASSKTAIGKKPLGNMKAKGILGVGLVAGQQIYDNWDKIEEFGEQVGDKIESFFKNSEHPISKDKLPALEDYSPQNSFSDAEKATLEQVHNPQIDDATIEDSPSVSLDTHELEEMDYSIDSTEMRRPDFLEGIDYKYDDMDMGEPGMEGNDGGDGGDGGE